MMEIDSDSNQPVVSKRARQLSGPPSPNSCPINPPKLNKCPDIVVLQILKFIADPKQQGNLLACRLVSTQWNGIIENTSDLMRNITFPVWHPKPFLDLPIVKNRKVKSISFSNCTLLEGNNYTNRFIGGFINAISENVEKVVFALKDKNIQEHCELLKLIMEKCINLQEISVQVNFNMCAMFRNNADLQIAAINKIHSVSVFIRVNTEFTNEDLDGLMKFILKLPNLKKIDMVLRIWPDDDFNNVLDMKDEDYAIKKAIQGFCEYIKKYGETNCLYLKKISCEEILPHRFTLEYEDFIEFLNLCEKYGVNYVGTPVLHLNTILKMDQNTSILGNRPLFKAKTFGVIVFETYEGVLTNFDRLHGLNISWLEICIGPKVNFGELTWIKYIKNLNHLLLKTRDLDSPLSDEWINEMIETLSDGLSSVESLDIVAEYFDKFSPFPWAQFFPNLKSLCLMCSDWSRNNNTANTLFSELSVLHNLSELKLVGDFVDNMFTGECASTIATGDGCSSYTSVMVPAITSFKTLKILDLMFCPLLTNACVINGIAKCKTLEKLIIYDCKNMTDEFRNSVKFEVILEQPECIKFHIKLNMN